MRKLEEVIDQMLNLIPGSEEALRSDLQSCQSSVLTASPEMMQFWWRKTAIGLEEYFCEEMNGEVQPPQLEPGSWQEQVFDIWTK